MEGLFSFKTAALTKQLARYFATANLAGNTTCEVPQIKLNVDAF